MDRILAIIIGWPVAFLILRFRRTLKDFTGDIAFAERVLGVGGTNTLIIIIALIVFVGSLMYAVGSLQAILDGILGPFF